MLICACRHYCHSKHSSKLLQDYVQSFHLMHSTCMLPVSTIELHSLSAPLQK